MATSLSASIVTNGLVFNYDMYNKKSYVGPPLTNILPNGINAGYPTYPSGWGTYNTNQYGSGTYFSIGTITGVSGNVITCPGHPLRTYDVVQPQTSGGGVTAATNYLVRKWNSNEFSLYGYDGTQDATNIFQTQVNLNTDNRISVSSGVPNMWWGYPHLPNSGIMKQIITNGFQYKGRVHDCIRIHWYRADGVKDGMAYGNEPSIVAGNTYTISFYHRAATPNIVGYSANIDRWTNGEYTGSTFTLRKNWVKHSYTFTTNQSGTTYFYWFNNNTPAQVAFDLAEIMIYQGSGSSEYVPSNTTRSNTQAIYDLTNNNTITATSLTYASDDTFSFNPANSNYIDSNPAAGLTGTGSWTMESWFKVNGAPSNVTYGNVIVDTDATGSSANMIVVDYGGGHGGSQNQLLYATRPSTGGGYTTLAGPVLTVGTYYHVAVVRNSTTDTKLYVNGILNNTYSGNMPTATQPLVRVGRWTDGTNYSNATIPVVKIYNRNLSDSEVLQNFNAQRVLYGV